MDLEPKLIKLFNGVCVTEEGYAICISYLEKQGISLIDRVVSYAVKRN